MRRSLGSRPQFGQRLETQWPPYSELASDWASRGRSRAPMVHPADQDFVRACTMAGARLNLRQIPWRGSGQQQGAGLTILVSSAKTLKAGTPLAPSIMPLYLETPTESLVSQEFKSSHALRNAVADVL